MAFFRTDRSKKSISYFKRNTLSKACIALFLCSTLLLMMSPRAFAYNLEGVKWPNQPAPGQCCASLILEVFNGTWYSDADKQAWINGAGVWSGSAALLTFGLVDSSPLWVYENADGTVNYDGITYLTSNGSALLSTQGYLNYAYTQNDSAATIQGIAAHELGHAIGLAHTNGCVLMTPDTSTRESCGITGPVQDDINGANALY